MTKVKGRIIPICIHQSEVMYISNEIQQVLQFVGIFRTRKTRKKNPTVARSMETQFIINNTNQSTSRETADHHMCCQSVSSRSKVLNIMKEKQTAKNAESKSCTFGAPRAQLPLSTTTGQRIMLRISSLCCVGPQQIGRVLRM